MDLLMGIDVGTSGCRVSIFTREGNIQGTASVAYSCRTPSTGASEIDSEIWWQSVVQCLHMLRNQGIAFQQIASIGVGGISWSPVAIDREGRPTTPVLTWLDQRSLPQTQALAAKFGRKRIFNLSGNPIQPGYCTGKLLWLKEHYSDAMSRTICFLQCNSYIVYKLTGALCGDYSQGYGYHFFDIVKRRYDAAFLKEMGFAAELFPELMESSTVAGKINRQASVLTGLPRGIPVVAGGLDAACCTLGAGVCHAGETQEQGGQAGGMSIAVDKPISHPKLILSAHVVPGLWLLQGGSTGGGGALRWFRDQLGAWEVANKNPGESDFAFMSREAATVPAGCGGLLFLPYMSGERSPIWDSAARGAFIGLSYEKTRESMIRSVMEGTAFSLRHNLDTAAETGLMVDRLYAVGGAANSEIWTQIKADITGLPITVPYSDQATPLGAAMLAGVGVGIYSSFDEAAAVAVHIQRTHTPDVSKRQLYDRLYQEYLKLYPALRETFRNLSTQGE
ncbi:MAG: xylulokinase [Christensenellales bacterium]|jgi:xylulokinase